MPAPGSTIGTAPSTLKLTFGEPPDPRLSSVKVLDSSGTNHATGGLTPAAGQPAVLTVAVGPLGDGVYTVAWRTVSEVDGHVAAGSFAFGVGVAPTSAAAASSETSGGGSPAAVVSRFLLYAGFMVLLGAGYVGFFVGRPAALRPDRLDRVLRAAWLVAAVGSVGVVAVTWSEAGADLASVAGTSIGQTGLLRLAAAVLAVVPVALVDRGGPRARHRWLALASLAAALALTVDVLNGHAGAATSAGGPFQLGVPLQEAAQWVHVIAAGLWTGGLATLLLTLRGVPSEEVVASVRRFSTWAAPWIVLVALTGALRAIEEVGTADALLASDYGRMVLVKTVLLVVLGVIGAGNRWFSVPMAIRSLRPLRQIGVTEIGVAIVIVVFSAGLVNGVPPASVGASAATAAPPPIVVSGSDQGTSVKVRLAITPGTAGFNAFDLVATDFDTGAPASATAVGLRFDLVSRSGVGESTLALQAGSNGGWAASGGNLSVDGIWRVTATITTASGGVEVPFVLATSLAGQPTDVLPTPGSPTIYTVHLADGTSCQLYLDPGTSGQNELHATFFDAAGNERPITQAAMAVTAGPGELLSPRLLEPGHFVSDLEVDAGTSTLPVDVVGLDAAGNQVHVHATIEVQP